MRPESYPKFLEKFIKTKTIISTAIEDTDNPGNGKIEFYINLPIELPEMIYEKTDEGITPLILPDKGTSKNIDGNKVTISSPLLKPGKEYIVKLIYYYNIYPAIIYLYSYRDPINMYKIELNHSTPSLTPKPPDDIHIYKRTMHIPLDDMIKDKNSILSLELTQDKDAFESLLKFKDSDWNEITDEIDDLDKLIENLFNTNYNRCMVKFFINLPTESTEKPAE